MGVSPGEVDGMVESGATEDAAWQSDCRRNRERAVALVKSSSLCVTRRRWRGLKRMVTRRLDLRGVVDEGIGINFHMQPRALPVSARSDSSPKLQFDFGGPYGIHDCCNGLDRGERWSWMDSVNDA